MGAFADIVTLETLGDLRFRAPTVPTSYERTFGGQLVAQALAAVLQTVDTGISVHSLHGYFLAPGDPRAPLQLKVREVRTGRTFSVREVTATQSGAKQGQDDQPMFVMQASLQRDGGKGPEHAAAMPTIPGPQEVPAGFDQLPKPTQAALREWDDWDLRLVPSKQWPGRPADDGRHAVWMRAAKPLGDDPGLHACALAYLSDMTLLFTARNVHPDVSMQIASLDHSLWFLRPCRADEWLCYVQDSPSAQSGRALTHGRFYDEHGRLVAEVMQEGLARMPLTRDARLS